MNLYFIFPALIATVLAWGSSDLLPFWSEVTAYSVTCTNGLKNGECDSEERVVYPATFKAIVEQQSVVYWFDTNETPQRLQHCTVRDARNWSCLLNNNMAEWRMIDGKFKDSSNKNAYAVSKLHWWWVKTTD